jgi:isopentenyldiphosphate isomerase
MNDIIQMLNDFKRTWHTEWDDPWCSCPKSEDGCADDREDKDTCTCGVDKHNQTIDQIIDAIKANNA